jgi:hypothetical protein
MDAEFTNNQPDRYRPAEIAVALDPFCGSVNAVIANLPGEVRPKEVELRDDTLGFTGDGRLIYAHAAMGKKRDDYDHFVFGTADPRTPEDADVRHVQVPHAAMRQMERGAEEEIYFDAKVIRDYLSASSTKPDPNLEWAIEVTNGIFGKDRTGNRSYGPYFIGRPEGDDGARDITFTNTEGLLGTVPAFHKTRHLHIITPRTVERLNARIEAEQAQTAQTAAENPPTPLDREVLERRARQPRPEAPAWDDTPDVKRSKARDGIRGIFRRRRGER